ncbi:MAG: hypothetical protein SGPRY_002125 [Prymnesium sp.]
MAVASVPHELLSRRTWEPLNGKQKGELFFARRRDALGVSCPKLQLEYFWYESLRGLLRGASAAASIERGEELCVVPLRKMITFHTIRNSSLAPMLAEFENASSEQVRIAMLLRLVRSVARRLGKVQGTQQLFKAKSKACAELSSERLQQLCIIRAQNFLEVYAIVRARDWVLPINNKEEYMMVPIVDMLNYGQEGGDAA